MEPRRPEIVRTDWRLARMSRRQWDAVGVFVRDDLHFLWSRKAAVMCIAVQDHADRYTGLQLLSTAYRQSPCLPTRGSRRWGRSGCGELVPHDADRFAGDDVSL